MFGDIKLSSRALTSLRLDERNPRLIGYRKRGKIKSEKEIIAVMVDNYDVMSLCYSILSNGFQPDEVLISIPCDKNLNKRIIVEGNRRLSACKILKKPDLLKDTRHGYQIAKIKKHKNYNLALNTIRKLHVVELDSRSLARSYIASKHTKESIKRWSVYTQGAYYIDLLNECTNIQELKKLINNTVPISRIKTVILFSRLADKIVELPTLTQQERKSILDDIDNIKVEAIIRVMQRSDFKEKIAKIKINDYGEIVVSGISEYGLQLVLAQLAKDTNLNKSLSTRQEDTTKMSTYIAGLAASIAHLDKPNDSNLGEEGCDDSFDFGVFNSSTDIEEGSETDISSDNSNNSSTVSASNIETTVRPKKDTSKLLNKKTQFTHEHEKLDALIEEAKRIVVSSYKHASVLLARTIIESILTIYITNSDQFEKYRCTVKYKYLELDTLLEYFINNTQALLLDETNTVKHIKDTLKQYKEFGKSTANLAIHNKDHRLTNLEVAHTQAKLQTLVDYFLPKLRAGQ